MTTAEKIAKIGMRLATFGDDAQSQAVVQRAVELNSWFTEQSVINSVRAIATDMLQPELLNEWLSHYPIPVAQPRRVLVIMAGNIPAVGFADLLCVVASGHTALVKYSSKDTPTMQYVVSLFAEYFDVREYDGCEPIDALLAMGSDATAAVLREKYVGVPMLIRASRNSLAVLSGDESASDLQGLCQDITAYDGRGCRSVSLVFVPCGYNFDGLLSALAECEVSKKWMQVYKHTKALCRMSGGSFIDATNTIVARSDEFPMNIATIHYVEYASQAEIDEWLNAHNDKVQCVVGRVSHSRAVAFGRAQHPTLWDYPDGIDTMQFLNSI